MRKDVSYSVLLTTGFRVDCKGKRISQAIRNCASQYPHLVKKMTPSFITYINGVSSFGFRQTEESRKAIESIKSKILMDKDEVRQAGNRGEASQFAIEWQAWTSGQSLSYGELSEWQAIFSELARKFDLQEEFIENGII